MTDTAIAASGLRKSYGEKVVLDGISLNVPTGTVFSLLGPNGAGKVAGGGPRTCSASSTWRTRPGRSPPPTPAGCAGGWIWP